LDEWTTYFKASAFELRLQIGEPVIGSSIKQLVGAIDSSMTAALTPQDKVAFWQANMDYASAKDMDNQQTTLGQVIRSQDGTTAANTLHSMPPQQTRDFKDSVSRIGSDDLDQQLRRQTIERYVSPSGNGTELGTLAQRFGKTEAEQVAAHLEPDAIEGLKNLSSISTPVYESLKGSTTAKRVVPVAESRAALAGLATAAGGLIGGHPGAMLCGLIPAAEQLVSGAAAKAVTSPGIVDWMMSPSVTKPGPSLVIPKLLAPAAATPEPTGEKKKQEPEAVPLPVATPSMMAEDEDKILPRHGVTPTAPAASPTA